MIQALLFDKDGTLFDFNRSWAVWAEDFLDEVAEGPAHHAALCRAMGYRTDSRSFAPDSAVIAGTPDEVVGLLEGLLPAHSREEIIEVINRAATRAAMVPAVSLGPLLAGFLAQGLRLGVVTNDSEAAALAHLEEAGVRGHFEMVVGYDSGFGAKPAAGGLLACAARFGVAPERMAMVGDSTHDLDAARAAGMRAVAVLTGVALREDLAPKADVVLDDIGQLPEWLAGAGG